MQTTTWRPRGRVGDRARGRACEGRSQGDPELKRKVQATIRIRTSQLDGLLNLISEVVISQIKAEQRASRDARTSTPRSARRGRRGCGIKSAPRPLVRSTRRAPMSPPTSSCLIGARVRTAVRSSVVRQGLLGGREPHLARRQRPAGGRDTRLRMLPGQHDLPGVPARSARPRQAVQEGHRSRSSKAAIPSSTRRCSRRSTIRWSTSCATQSITASRTRRRGSKQASPRRARSGLRRAKRATASSSRSPTTAPASTPRRSGNRRFARATSRQPRPRACPIARPRTSSSRRDSRPPRSSPRSRAVASGWTSFASSWSRSSKARSTSTPTSGKARRSSSPYRSRSPSSERSCCASATWSFALPTGSIEETLRVDPAEIIKVEGREVIRRQRRTIPLVRLSEILGVPEDPASEGEGPDRHHRLLGSPHGLHRRRVRRRAADRHQAARQPPQEGRQRRRCDHPRCWRRRADPQRARPDGQRAQPLGPAGRAGSRAPSARARARSSSARTPSPRANSSDRSSRRPATRWRLRSMARRVSRSSARALRSTRSSPTSRCPT